MADPPVIDISSSPATESKAANSSHRLPTVYASQALQDLQSNEAGFVSLGLPALDSRLSGANTSGNDGIERGKVTEAWGPAGAGKTAVALQAAVSTLKSGSGVLWIDGSAALHSSRLKSVVSAAISDCSSSTQAQILKRFRRFPAPTLSHLLALILHPFPGLIPEKTSLLVIDDLNMLVDLDYPRQQFATTGKTEQQKWQSTRRYGILGTIISALNKLAVLNNLAVIITTGCSTRNRSDSGLGSAFAPGIGGAEWDAGIWNRLVVFRDFSGRLIGTQKCQGKIQISREEIGETGRILAFDTSPSGGIQECQSSRSGDETSTALAKARISPVKPRKRTFDEIADSESEEVDEYGWAEADDDVLAAEGLGEDTTIAAKTSTENG